MEDTMSLKQKTAVNWWQEGEYTAYAAIICDGAIRSGKTLAVSRGFLRWVFAQFNKQTFALCSKTISAAKRNIIPMIEEDVLSLGGEFKERWSENYLTITLGEKTNRFYLFGGKDESSAALIQGMTLAGVLFDEVVLMPQSFVEQAVARCSVFGSRFWFTCNPSTPSSWFYREWICKAAEKNALYLHFTMEDNPSLDASIKARYEKLYTGVFYDRYIRGEWVIGAGLIYPDFSVERHVVKKVPDCEKYYISCDYGTRHPFSLGLWGEKDGVWYRCREFYYDAEERGKTLTDEAYYCYLERLARREKIEYVVCDPSAASFMACIVAHRRYAVLAADNAVIPGIQDVARLLETEKIKFHESCRDIIREFGLYEWDKKEIDAPIKENDHAMDDMRYFVRSIVTYEDSFGVTSVRRG